MVLPEPWVRVSKCFSKSVVDACVGRSARAALLLGVVTCSGCPPWGTCYTLVFQGLLHCLERKPGPVTTLEATPKSSKGELPLMEFGTNIS